MRILPYCVNARDVGGLRTGQGSTVVKRTLLRSDNLDQLTPAGISELHALGVVRILDLRFEWEARKYPGPFSTDPIYVNVPLVGIRDNFDPDAPVDYRPEIDLYPRQIATAFTAFFEAPTGPVLVHCHVVRDRTGMFVALALAVAGATTQTIIEDYVLSDGAEASTMAEMLECVKHRYGGARNYLLAAGMREHQADAIVRRLTVRGER